MTADVGRFRKYWQTLTRSEVQRALDRIVDDNRVTIAIVFPVVGAGLLVASAEGWVPAPFAFHPIVLLLGVAVMRSPLLIGMLPTVDRRVARWMAILAVLTYAIELTGVQTGWLYGSFTYGISLGPMIAGIPAALPLLFIPLVINAYLLWIILLGERGGHLTRILLVVPTVVLLDVVLDPAAVGLGFWEFLEGGEFYDVPLSNYQGWVVSATIATVVVEYAFDREQVRRRLHRCSFMLDDLVSFVILWGIINAWFGHTIPVGVAIVLGLAVLIALLGRGPNGAHSDHW